MDIKKIGCKKKKKKNLKKRFLMEHPLNGAQDHFCLNSPILVDFEFGSIFLIHI